MWISIKNCFDGSLPEWRSCFDFQADFLEKSGFWKFMYYFFYILCSDHIYAGSCCVGENDIANVNGSFRICILQTGQTGKYRVFGDGGSRFHRNDERLAVLYADSGGDCTYRGRYFALCVGFPPFTSVPGDFFYVCSVRCDGDTAP